MESRASKQGSLKSPISPGNNSNSSAAPELALAYSKLKKQFDSTRKELSDLSISHERLKNESQKEIGKWKAKFVSAYEAGADKGSVPGPDARELRRKLASLERTLENERLEHRKAVAEQRKQITELMRRPLSSARSASSGSAVRAVSAGSTRATSADRARMRETAREKQREIDRNARSRSGKHIEKTRDTSAGRHSSRSVSPSSSVSKKFDPTEWFNQQKEKRERSTRQAWGGGASERYYESGYASGNSDQSSKGSSRRSNSARSNASDDSKGSRASSRGSRQSISDNKKVKERPLSGPPNERPRRGIVSEEETGRRKKPFKKSSSRHNDPLDHFNRGHSDTIPNLPSGRRRDADVGINDFVLQPRAMPLSARDRSPRQSHDFNTLNSADNDVLTWNKKIATSTISQPRTAPSASPLSLRQQVHEESLVSNLMQQKTLRETLNSENVKPNDRNSNGRVSAPVPFPMSDLRDLSAVDAYISRSDISVKDSNDSFVRKSSESLDYTSNKSQTNNMNLLSPCRPTSVPTAVADDGKETESDLSEIDKRIMALQSFLENARSGIFHDQTAAN